jgi:hypothetical protein
LLTKHTIAEDDLLTRAVVGQKGAFTTGIPTCSDGVRQTSGVLADNGQPFWVSVTRNLRGTIMLNKIIKFVLLIPKYPEYTGEKPLTKVEFLKWKKCDWVPKCPIDWCLRYDYCPGVQIDLEKANGFNCTLGFVEDYPGCLRRRFFWIAPKVIEVLRDVLVLLSILLSTRALMASV